MGANVRPPRTRHGPGAPLSLIDRLLDRTSSVVVRYRSSPRPPRPAGLGRRVLLPLDIAPSSHSSRTMSTAAAPHAFVILRFSDKNRFGKNGVPALRPYSGGQRCVIRMKEATLEKACAAARSIPPPPAWQPTPYATQGQARPVRQGGAGGRQHGGPPHGAARQRRRVPSRAAGVPAPLRDQALPLPGGRVVGAAAGGAAGHGRAARLHLARHRLHRQCEHQGHRRRAVLWLCRRRRRQRQARDDRDPCGGRGVALGVRLTSLPLGQGARRLGLPQWRARRGGAGRAGRLRAHAASGAGARRAITQPGDPNPHY